MTNPLETLLSRIEEVESILGYAFTDRKLLVLAFTHRSFFNEHRTSVEGHNERLEFLGDAVLGLVISNYLYTHLPAESEGHLSHLCAHLVGAEACISYMQELKLEEFLLLGRGEADNVGKGRERILADLFEAIIGAIYLDGGLIATMEFIQSHFAPYFDRAIAHPFRNWKAELQDYSQKKFQKPPEYRILEESGPPHERCFVVVVCIEKEEVGQGSGTSKKQAEQAAAEDALRRIERDD